MKKTRVSLRFRSEGNEQITEKEIKDILRKTSDFQHSNIVMDSLQSAEDSLYTTLYIYTEDIEDKARTRAALHELVDFLLS